MVDRPAPRLCNRAPHHLAEIPLVFRVEGDDAGFRRADHHFARVEDALPRLFLESLHDQQKKKTALEELDAKEIGHEADIGVVAENLVDRVGRIQGMGDGRGKGRGRGPKVLVLDERDGIPLADQENVQYMHQIGCVRDDGLSMP